MILQYLDNKQFVEYCYLRILGRKVSDKGYDVYVKKLDKKQITRVEVIRALANSEEYNKKEIPLEQFPYKTKNGYKAKPNGATIHLKNAQTFEADSYYFRNTMLSLIEKQGIQRFADIGSYHGFYTVTACKAGLKCDSFGMSEKNFEILKENIRLNNVQAKANLINKAVTQKENIFYDEKGPESSTSETGEISADTISLDNYYTNKSNPDLIKIDVEGSEFQVLEGAQEVITESKPFVAMDVHLNMIDRDINEVKNYFNERGYIVNILDSYIGKGSNIKRIICYPEKSDDKDLFSKAPTTKNKEGHIDYEK